jgi:hypothetical protein
MTTPVGHKRTQQLIEGEAFRRIMAGEAPATLDAFARDLARWLGEAHPDAAPVTRDSIARLIHATWDKRHEMIRGGDL